MSERLKAERLAPGWREMGSFSAIAEATASFNQARDAKGGFVYFCGPSDGLVKIGFTTNLRARFRALQNGSAVPIKLLAATPGTRHLEQVYHTRFAGDRAHGEWFTRSPAILAEIASIGGPG